MSRTTRIAGAVAAGCFVTGIGVLETTVAGRRLSRRLARSVTRMARYESGRLEGIRYHLSGRRPDISASDRLLGDRVRSVLGPLEHRLDVPRVHVQAQGHEVLLHGDVPSEKEAAEITGAVRKIAGVEHVSSHLHVGLFPGDTKPSQAADHPGPSAALSSVLAAAHGAGVPRGSERAAARSVLSAFAALLPKGARRHVLAHLPADLRSLAEPPRPNWIEHRHPRRVEDFALAALPTYEASTRESVVESVLGALRDLVPEEAADVAAVLPGELRDLWKTAIPL
jgi:uncharacterized protein (DUF2267 family)